MMTQTIEEAELRSSVRGLVSTGLALAREAAGSGKVSTIAERPLFDGFAGVAVPEERGGAGGGLEQLALVLRELGRSLWPGTFTRHVVATQTALAAGYEVSASAFSGEDRWTLGLPRPHRDLAPLGAEPNQRVVLLGEDEVAFGVVSQARTIEGIDRTRPPARIVVSRTDAGRPAPQALARAHVLLLAEQLGSGEGALALALAHARTREQFGRPIAAFQAVAHQLADVHVRLVEADALLTEVTRGVEVDANDAWGGVAAARALVIESTVHAAERCLQVHGALGMTVESDVHLFLTRLTASGAVVQGHRRSTREAGRAFLESQCGATDAHEGSER